VPSKTHQNGKGQKKALEKGTIEPESGKTKKPAARGAVMGCGKRGTRIWEKKEVWGVPEREGEKLAESL